MEPVKISSSILPKQDIAVFPSSAFFRKTPKPQQLPTPVEVKAQAARIHTFKFNTYRPPPVQFPSLNLMVKYGGTGAVTVTEGQCLWMIRTYLGHVIPVPEIYGWCRDGDETFIYMELIRGPTLEQRWDELSVSEKSSICDQLRPMMTALGTLRQSSQTGFIGNITGGPLQDIIFEGLKTPAGPFSHVSQFHDNFSLPSWAIELGQTFEMDPMRPGLPDDPINFVHGDLHRSNILITSAEKGPPHVLAIIDWHQSGWYPAYWEYCKARWTAEIGDEWVTIYIPKIMQPRTEVYDFWNWFVLARGC